MNIKEQAALLGRVIVANFNGLGVHATIEDIKESYGQRRYLVKPLAGTGLVWINADRAEFVEVAQ